MPWNATRIESWSALPDLLECFFLVTAQLGGSWAAPFTF
jgi:hypothetical protein